MDTTGYDQEKDTIRQAILDYYHEGHAKNDAQFYETVCLNRGWQVHVAATRKECIDWLFTQHK